MSRLREKFDTKQRFQAESPWLFALLGLFVLSWSYLSVLHRAVDITGDMELFFIIVTGAFVGGITIGRFAMPLIAYLCAAFIAAGGVALYVPTLPEGYSFVISTDILLADFGALVTGLSILRIINAGVWATAVAPVPVFLTSYFASRKQYGRATSVGCVALGFFILTGDIDVTTGLIGVLGAAATVGFGDLDHSGGNLSAANALAIVLAVIVVLTATVSVVPGGESHPVLSREGANDPQTVEGSLTNADNELSIQGSIRLSPSVRFTVESDQQAYWRVGAYDRYTGSSWIRTVNSHSYNGSLSQPPGPNQNIRQTVRAKQPVNVMPAAWKPISVDNHSARVTGFEGVQPETRLNAGDSYTVVSSVPAASPEELRTASDDYPDEVLRRYTKNPGSTPERVKEYTDELTTNANNSYDTARIIEEHLQQSKNYSLDVQRPNDHIADSFLFEMDRGYCTYFATTMVTMLRTQEIPARFVVGYTPGQRVDSNKWVVRGLNSHAWVEVYIPEYGWIKFDPTPGGARQQAEQNVIETARSEGVPNVDTNETEPTPTPTPDENESAGNGTTSTETSTTQSENQQETREGPSNNPSPPGFTPSGESDLSDSDDDDEGGLSDLQITLPSRDRMFLGTIVLLGIAAVVRRSGVGGRAYREVWLRRQPRTDPESDIERAFERLEYILAREHRPRRPGETRKQYVRVVGDDSVRRVEEIYERAVYGGEATEALADEAIDIVDQRVRERSLL